MSDEPGLRASVRIDQWLWAIRLYKTRAAASDACKGGHVRIAGKPAKASSKVSIGDRVEARAQGRAFIVEPTKLIIKRVGAAVAAECYVDHSPPPPPPDKSGKVAVRDRGSGRPTKKERRQMDRFRGSGA